MSEIKIVEKIVAPNTNWTHFTLDHRDENVESCAYKMIFDRKYPYFWVWSPFGGREDNGLALSYADLERAALFDEGTNEFTGFDMSSDGIMPFIGSMTFCIAMGARQAFYILSNMSHIKNPYGGLCTIYVSAQDDPVCPFVTANPWNS